MKVSDFIADFIHRIGVTHVFTVSGAGNLHILDSIHRHRHLKYVCNHHEQASAMAMYGYARAVGGPGVCLVTTGPGATNAITGACSAWVDSIPGLIISGQVKRADMIGDSGLRQRGIQEINIIDMVRPVTKFAAVVQRPEDIRLMLEKAISIACDGRPGPVWLDIPMDIQAAHVDETTLEPWVADAAPTAPVSGDLEQDVLKVISMIRQSRRPVILAGHGIRLAGATDLFRQIIEHLNIPVLTSWNAIDIIESDHPLYVGRPGTYGQRGANFAIQNSDLLVSVGSRLNITQTGYDYDLFAREAKKVMVDIDPHELGKFPRPADLAIQADAGDFLAALWRAGKESLHAFSGEDWLARCRTWSTAYPACLDSYKEAGKPVNSFDFVDVLSDILQEGDIIVPTASGSGFTSSHQALKIRKGQRCFTSNGFAEMGFDIPGAIGACVGFGGKRVVTMTGDGGVQMNIQELQTIRNYNLPVKLFIFCNNGYLTIRQTQNALFNGEYSGSDPESGVILPDFGRIAEAYGIRSFSIPDRDSLERGIREVLECEGPAVCMVTMQSAQALVPKTSFRILDDGRMVSPPIEDLFPFLSREEFMSNMIIPVVES